MNNKYLRHTRSVTILIICSFTILVGCTAKMPFTPEVTERNYGEMAYTYLQHINQHFERRESGTKREEKMGDFLIQELTNIGIDKKCITEQPFALSYQGESKNIIVVKPGRSAEQIIVGAHYDSAYDTKGVDDNGSGVAVVLETIRRLWNENLEKTIIFAFWGAEESGFEGSSYYVDQMTEGERANTIAYLNIDSIIGGDRQYIYGCKVDAQGNILQTEQVEAIYKLSKELELVFELNPGYNTDIPTPTVGDISDHVPFKEVDIPYVYFEAANWELEPFTGTTQTEKLGRIMHTKYDNLAQIERHFPDRGKPRLEDFTLLLYNSIKLLTT